MAHNSDYTRLYIGDDGQGIGIAEVARCLKTNSLDLGTLCTSARINPWAKYKPTRLNFKKLTGKSSGHSYWRGDDGKCGFEFTTYTNLGTLTSGLISELNAGNTEWGRRLPLGGSSAYRVLDFDGYYAAAENPVGSIGGQTIWVGDDGTGIISFETFDLDPDNLKLSDIQIDGVSLSQFYLAFLFVKGTQYWMTSSASPIGDGGLSSIELTDLGTRTGSWKMIPFYSDRRITPTGQLSAGKYCTANIAPLVINIMTWRQAYSGFVSAAWNSTHTQVSCEAVVSAYASGRTFSALRVYIYADDALVAQSAAFSLTVPDQGNASHSLTLAVSNYDPARRYTVTVQPDYGTGAIECDPYEIEESLDFIE